MFQVYLFFLVLCGGLALLSVVGDFLDTDVGEMDADVATDIDPDAVDADLSTLNGDGGPEIEVDTDAEKIFSIRGGLYTLFGFGLTGTLLTSFGAPAAAPITIAASAASGLGAGWIVTILLNWLKTTEAGERVKDRSFVGRSGRMMLPMEPGDGTGRVRVRRGEKTYDLRALPHPAAAPDTDPSGWDRVMVIEVREGVALVAPVDAEGLPVDS